MRLSVRALGLLAILTFLIYGHSLTSAFVFDDHWTVLQNPSLRSISNPVRFFTDTDTSAAPSMGMGKDIYRPLSTLTFWVDYHFFKTNPAPYRLENLLLHFLNAFLLFLLLKHRLQFSEAAALIGAALFLSHPAQVESVVWITQRSNLLCLSGILAGLLWLTSPREAPWKTAAGILCALLAMASKETAVVFLLFLILADAVARPAVSLNELIEARRRLYIPLLLSTLLFIGWRHAVVGSLVQRSWRTGHLAGNILFGARAWVDYLKVLLWPVNLTVSHAEPSINPFRSALAWIGLLSWIVFWATAVALWRRGKRAPAAGLMWFFIGLAPVLGFIPLVTYMAERFLYIPLAGAAILAAWLWSHWISFSKITALGSGVLLTATLATASFQRAQDWRDDLSLWKSAAAAEPGNAFAWACLGDAQLVSGQWDDARRSYENVFTRQPDEALAFTAANNLAEIDNRRGRPDEALSWAKKDEAIEPDVVETLYNHIVALALLHRHADAIKELAHAEAVHPGNPAWAVLRERLHQRPSPK